MSQRTIQPGDYVVVTVDNQQYALAITGVESDNIIAGAYIIRPVSSIWQVHNYSLPHSVTFENGQKYIGSVARILPEGQGTDKSEQPIHSVYLRDGPRKIIMLLKPRSAEVVYTPFGITELALNRYKLPSYVVATGIVSRDPGKYILLPYKKGRSESEIEELIIRAGPLVEYNIVDIEGGELYRGQYGHVAPVKKKLRELLSCQSGSHINLTRIPKTFEIYSTFEEAVRTGVYEEGDAGIIMGKKDEYIIVVDVGFNDILRDIRKCGDSRPVNYLVVASTDRLRPGDDENSHALAFTIDLSSDILEVFDPNGITPETRHVYYWVNKLLDYLKTKGIVLKRHITADEPFCPQRLSGYAKEFKGEGQCVIWSFWYLWLKIHNPTVPGSAIRSYMMNMTPDDSYDRITRIASLIYN
jgi:hypothetical protein